MRWVIKDPSNTSCPYLLADGGFTKDLKKAASFSTYRLACEAYGRHKHLYSSRIVGVKKRQPCDTCGK